jgi:hypothetical protein
MVRYAAGAETRRKLVPRFVKGETRPPVLPKCCLPDFFKVVMSGLLEFGFGVGKRRCDPGVSSHCDRNVLNAAAARKSEDSQSASHLFLNIRSCAIGTDRRGGGRRRARRCITAGCPCLAGRRRSLDAHRPHRVSPDHSAARFRIHRVRERVEQAPKNSPKKAFDLPRRLSPAALGPKTILHNFANERHNRGYAPDSRLLPDGKGVLYGTALFGGFDGVGTVFELKP